MRFQLPKLDFSPGDFGNFLSAESFEYHYGKHHQGYIDQTNQLIQATPFESAPLETIVREAKDKLFNQASQAWNHTFFWKSMTPEKETCSRELESAIQTAFGSLERFGQLFVEKGVAQFGSGWVWLVENTAPAAAETLSIITTSNADTPLRQGLKPLLVCDVWEHAYYIDHRNAREAFLKEWTGKIAWRFASENFANPEAPKMGDFMIHESGWEPLRTETAKSEPRSMSQRL